VPGVVWKTKRRTRCERMDAMENTAMIEVCGARDRTADPRTSRQGPLDAGLAPPPSASGWQVSGAGPPAGHAPDPDAEHNPSALFMRGKRNGGGLPPHRMALKEALRDRSRALMFGRRRELLVMSEYDHARPLPVSCELVELETHERILSHPFDFLTQRGVAVEKFAVQVDVNGNDVRLVVPGARQSSDVCRAEHRAALLLRHLLNYHPNALRNI